MLVQGNEPKSNTILAGTRDDKVKAFMQKVCSLSVVTGDRHIFHIVPALPSDNL